MTNLLFRARATVAVGPTNNHEADVFTLGFTFPAADFAAATVAAQHIALSRVWSFGADKSITRLSVEEGGDIVWTKYESRNEREARRKAQRKAD